MAGKLTVTSPYRLVADVNTSSETNNVKGQVQTRVDGKYPTNPTQGYKTGIEDRGEADQAESMQASEQEKYLNSGELAFPADSAMYNYLKQDEGSDEAADLDKGYDAVETPRDHKTDYSAKRYGK